MTLLSNKKPVLCLLLLCSMFGLAVFFAAVSAEAATPSYVYIVSPQADVEKYDIANGKIVATTGFYGNPDISSYFPADTGGALPWMFGENNVTYDSKNQMLYAFIPPVEGGVDSAFLKIQMPDWKLIKGIRLMGIRNVKLSPDFGKFFVHSLGCTGEIDVETGLGKCEDAVDVYDTATFVKTKSYKGTVAGSYLMFAYFANDGTSAYHYNDISDMQMYKYSMSDSVIIKNNIVDAISEDTLLPAGRWDQIVEKYGYVKPEYDGKIVRVDERLLTSLNRETFIQGITGKAALIYTDVTKPEIYGTVIEDIPVKKAQNHLSDDGTKAYVAEFQDVYDESGLLLTQKLTGNIYIYTTF